MVGQSPPPSNQTPPLPPGSGQQGDLPKFTKGQWPNSRPPPSGGVAEDPVYSTEATVYQELCYWLWPLAMWGVVLFNGAVMACSIIGMGTTYNFWSHLEAAGVSVLTLGVLAVIYKWVLQGPDGLPNRVPYLPRLTAR